MSDTFCSRAARTGVLAAILLLSLTCGGRVALAAPQAPDAGGGPAGDRAPAGGEANLVLPDLGPVDFQGINGRTLLMGGLVVCVLGLAFGLVIYTQLKNLPVHRSMLEISELIYETCKTYLITQGKFILLLELFIGVIMVFYFGVLQHFAPIKVADHPAVQPGRHRAAATASPGSASASTRSPTRAPRSPACAGKPYPIYAIPLSAGMSIGMLLISVELFIMLCILLFIPGDYAGACFIGFAIGESLGAAALRIAGGIFTKIADIGADLMKIVFNIKEDDARNPGRHRRLHGRQRGRLGRPERRRLRDLRRHRRRADLVHPPRRDRPDGPGPAARLDLRHAHHDGHRQRRVVPAQRGMGEGAVRQRARR